MNRRSFIRDCAAAAVVAVALRQSGTANRATQAERRTAMELDVRRGKQIGASLAADILVALAAVQGWPAALASMSKLNAEILEGRGSYGHLSGTGPSCDLATARPDRRSPGPRVVFLSPPGGPVSAPGEPFWGPL